ncbi:hypothetical protein BCR36DRAFT_583207 [Piromyces finnis]|uniref:Uncharacterized protein n=1 Tax=Piromyces finnis TaxID=1754191 RepID=A0A1Y1V9J1_9FUNG|nr:hypothetical protein BCR36DRAFT_583207 [Piromyces finnis]|eukprot:ORX50621.1 hypothetical protein BCR36DRAFT_583207 [Piromyces finnis]
MQFKNINIILSFIYFASTVISAPISENDVNGKNPFIEASPIPVKADKNLFEGLLKAEGINKRDSEKNPFIEASPIPVKADKNLFEGLINH